MSSVTMSSARMSSASVLAREVAPEMTREVVVPSVVEPRTSAAAQSADGHAHDLRDVLGPEDTRRRERFIPITRHALVDRLTRPQAWGPGEAIEARRFFRYLDYWRQQSYATELVDLEPAYEPFSPDSDLLQTRKFTVEEKMTMQKRVVSRMRKLLQQANYEEIDPKQVEVILTRESHYGLDLFVDLDAFEEIMIFYRGASTRTEERRHWRRFMRKEEFEVPIFRRLFLLFKLKPAEMRVRELMQRDKLTRSEAEKRVQKARALVPREVKDDNIYMKLFKNVPRSDIEMIFPNTQVRFRLLDKIKLGVTAGGGLGMGAVGAAGKIALISSNPVTAAGAVFGLGGIAFRQFMNFTNQRQRYMVVMAQNLYFHALADNGSAMIKLANRAAEEDFKEEILLYCVLAKERATRRDLKAIDLAIEQYLHASFGTDVDFDLGDALDRLMRDGLVTEGADGILHTLPPREAARHIDGMWDQLLDMLPDPTEGEGVEDMRRVEEDGAA